METTIEAVKVVTKTITLTDLDITQLIAKACKCSVNDVEFDISSSGYLRGAKIVTVESVPIESGGA